MRNLVAILLVTRLAFAQNNFNNSLENLKELKMDINNIVTNIENFAADVVRQLIDVGEASESDRSANTATTQESLTTNEPTTFATTFHGILDSNEYKPITFNKKPHYTRPKRSVRDTQTVEKPRMVTDNPQICSTRSQKELQLEKQHIEGMKQEIQKLNDLVKILRDQQKILNVLNSDGNDLSKRFDTNSLMEVLRELSEKERSLNSTKNYLQDANANRRDFVQINRPTHEELERIKIDLRETVAALNKTKSLLAEETEKENKLERELTKQKGEIKFLRLLMERLFESVQLRNDEMNDKNDLQNSTGDGEMIVGSKVPHLPKTMPNKTTSESPKSREASVSKTNRPNSQARARDSEDIEKLLTLLGGESKKTNSNDLRAQLKELEQEIEDEDEKRKQEATRKVQMELLQRIIKQQQKEPARNELASRISQAIIQNLNQKKELQPQGKSDLLDDDVQNELKKLQTAISQLRPKDGTTVLEDNRVKSEQEEFQAMLTKILAQNGPQSVVGPNVATADITANQLTPQQMIQILSRGGMKTTGGLGPFNSGYGNSPSGFGGTGGYSAGINPQVSKSFGYGSQAADFFYPQLPAYSGSNVNAFQNPPFANKANSYYNLNPITTQNAYFSPGDYIGPNAYRPASQAFYLNQYPTPSRTYNSPTITDLSGRNPYTYSFLKDILGPGYNQKSYQNIPSLSPNFESKDAAAYINGNNAAKRQLPLPYIDGSIQGVNGLNYSPASPNNYPLNSDSRGLVYQSSQNYLSPNVGPISPGTGPQIPYVSSGSAAVNSAYGPANYQNNLDAKQFFPVSRKPSDVPPGSQFVQQNSDYPPRSVAGPGFDQSGYNLPKPAQVAEDYKYRAVDDLRRQIENLENVIKSMNNRPDYAQKPEDQATIANLEQKIRDLKDVVASLNDASNYNNPATNNAPRAVVETANVDKNNAYLPASQPQPANYPAPLKTRRRRQTDIEETRSDNIRSSNTYNGLQNQLDTSNKGPGVVPSLNAAMNYNRPPGHYASKAVPEINYEKYNAHLASPQSQTATYLSKTRRRRQTDLEENKSDGVLTQLTGLVRKILDDDTEQKNTINNTRSSDTYTDLQRKLDTLKTQLAPHTEQQRHFDNSYYKTNYQYQSVQAPITQPYVPLPNVPKIPAYYNSYGNTPYSASYPLEPQYPIPSKSVSKIVSPKHQELFTSIVIKILDKLIGATPAILERLFGYGINELTYSYGDSYSEIQNLFKNLGFLGYIPLIIVKLIDGAQTLFRILKKNTFFKRFLLPAIVLALVAGSIFFLIWFYQQDDYGENYKHDVSNYHNYNHNGYTYYDQNGGTPHDSDYYRQSTYNAISPVIPSNGIGYSSRNNGFNGYRSTYGGNTIDNVGDAYSNSYYPGYYRSYLSE